MWARLKDANGKWLSLSTPFDAHQFEQARAWADRRQVSFECDGAGSAFGAYVVFARHASKPSTRQGWIYAIALIPEWKPWRIKVGWSTDVADRLAHFQAVCPTAKLIGAWDADRADEPRVHGLLRGRIGRSEVFETKNPESLLCAIDAAMGRP